MWPTQFKETNYPRHDQIGTGHIIDASPLEELCAEAKLTITVNKDGQICGIQKGSDGGIEPGLMSEMIQTAKRVGQSLIQQLDQKLFDEEKQVDDKRRNGEHVEKLGFFAMVWNRSRYLLIVYI